MPQSIVKLSQSILGNPEKVTIKPEQATAEKVEQALYFVSKKVKQNYLRTSYKKMILTLYWFFSNETWCK